MKHYKIILVMVFFVNYGLSVSADAFQGDATAYTISITTIGDDTIVDAIKRYSDIAETDVARWGYSWIPLVGSNIRDGMIVKVRDFMRVCRGLFKDSTSLMSWRSLYDDTQVCRALNYLYKQGESARALLGRFGTQGEKYLYNTELNTFIGYIKDNKKLMAGICDQIKAKKEVKSQKQVKTQRDQLEYTKLWWRTQELRWKMAKDMSTQAFKGVKWIAQTVNENSTPLLSAAAAWYFWDKLMGTRRPEKQRTWGEMLWGSSSGSTK
jgi:hypothetical protein